MRKLVIVFILVIAFILTIGSTQADNIEIKQQEKQLTPDFSMSHDNRNRYYTEGTNTLPIKMLEKTEYPYIQE